MVENLDVIIYEIRERLSAMDKAREKVLPLCRSAIRCCSQAIRAIHRHEFEQAVELLKSAREMIAGAEGEVACYSGLASGGFMLDAQKELAEGMVTLALVNGQELPGPAELGVEPAAYLNGLGEAVGELRRYLLDSLRHGEPARGEELLGAMDDIYSALVTMDFPDAITGGLRRTTDSVRGILEKTRSDLTLVIQQKALEEKLEKLEPSKTAPAHH